MYDSNTNEHHRRVVSYLLVVNLQHELWLYMADGVML